MASRKHSAIQPRRLSGKLREAEIVQILGGTVADACRRVGVMQQTFFRWRKEFRGLKVDQARRTKELEASRWNNCPNSSVRRKPEGHSLKNSIGNQRPLTHYNEAESSGI